MGGCFPVRSAVECGAAAPLFWEARQSTNVGQGFVSIPSHGAKAVLLPHSFVRVTGMRRSLARIVRTDSLPRKAAP